MSELVLPITLWNGPPPHSITSILFVLSRAVLVTGSSSGQLCIWSIETEKPNKEGGLTPLIVCMGHNAPIKSLVECNFEGKDAFVSMSTDGVMHVWSAQDGKCLGGTTFTSFYPLSLVCIPGDRRLIAVAGSHSEIEIIDAWTLKSTTTLRAHSDWITCLASMLCNGEPVLMSGSRDGLVHFWSLKPNEDFPLRTVCFDEGPVPSMHPLEMSISPDLRSFVLVTGSRWQLYTAQNSRLVCSVACPEGSEWLGAKYLDNDTLLVWTSHALAAAYKLSIPSHAEPLSLIPSTTASANIEMPKNLSATFDMNPNGETSLKILSGVQPGSVFLPVRSGSTTDATSNYLPAILYTINEFPLEPVRQTTPQQETLSKPEPALPDFASLGHRYESSFSQFAACSDSFFAVGDTTGQVTMWIVRSDNFAAWCGGRIADGWKGVESPAKAVTTSLVLEDQLLLIRGHENGQISTCNLPTDAFPKYNKAHSARVNCLMCSPIIGTTTPATSNPANATSSNPISSNYKRFLISGSDDFTIKVWELSTFELLHTFTHHTGPVTCLFPPPPRPQQGSEVFWDNTFFAVSDDKCVGFYSTDSMVCRHMFGVHPALVSAVKSRRDQDYLLVECADGCVAVWEMGTGELEGIVSGQVAREISENSDTIWTSHSSPQGVSLAGGMPELSNAASPAAGVRMSSLPNLQRSPIQILFLDIKQIIRELYRTQVAAPAAIQSNASISKKPVPSTSSSSLTNGPAAASTSGTNITTSGGSINTSGSGGSGGVGSNINTSGSGASSLLGRQRQSLQLPNPTTGAAITSLPAYQVFSYLIPWGVDKAMDTLCKKEMMLRPPVPDFAFGIKGDCGNISVLVPSASGVGRWQCSPELTALITLSAVSLAKALLNLGDGKNSCIQILSYYCALLPETLGPRSSYVDPSLPLLASYWLDPLEDIMSAARSILVSTIDRLSPDDRKELTQSVALQLKQATEGNTRGLLVVVLGIIGAERPEALDELAARSSVIELLKILYKGGAGPFTQAAVELLGKGFAAWRAHIKDVTRLIRALFTLSLQNDSLGQTAHHALMLTGAQDPKQFILCIGAEIHRDNSTHTHAAPNNSSPAIMLLGSLIKKDACALLGQLPRLVETVVKSLDPHTPALRDACLKATTTVLQIMVKKYPMVSFHQDSQRLAVGTSENVIIIYDLKTATRWHVLEGHKNAVSAVAFNENGKALASYSILETTVRIWHTGTSFFGILGSQPQCVKTFTVSKPTKIISPQVQLETVRLQWVSPSTLTLFRGWEQGTTFTVDPVA